MPDNCTDAEQHKSGSGWIWIAGVLTLMVFVANGFMQSGEILFFRILGFGMLFLAPVFYFPPMFTLKKHGGIPDGKDYMQTTNVVDMGLFAIVRHPQYMGYIFFNLGFVSLSQQWWVVIMGLLAIYAFYRQIRVEERQLLYRFGNEYSEYCQRVPRLNWVLGLLRR